jgi:hypothetical protein
MVCLSTRDTLYHSVNTNKISLLHILVYTLDLVLNKIFDMNLKSSVHNILLYSKSIKLLLASIYFNKYYV